MQEDFSVQIRCVWSVFTSQLIFGVESQCFFSGVCSQLLLLSFHRWTPAGTARTRAPSCRGRDGRWIDEGICATLPQVHHHHHHHHQLAIALLCWTPATKTCPRPRKNSRLNIFVTLVCLFVLRHVTSAPVPSVQDNATMRSYRQRPTGLLPCRPVRF